MERFRKFRTELGSACVLFFGFLAPVLANEPNFGDEVVACAARSHIAVDSSNLDAALKACEILVSKKRASVAKPIQTGITAGELAQYCASSDRTEQAMCYMVTKAFMDGWIEGVAEGTLKVFVHDQAAFNSVKDLKATELQPKLKGLIDKAACIQGMDVAALSGSFAEYVVAHPRTATSSYRTAMYGAIKGTCR